MLDRRSFLTRVASGLIGASVIDVEWVPTAITRPVLTDLSTLEGITAEMLRQMVACAPDMRGAFVPGRYDVGDHGLTTQWNVQIAPGVDEDVNVDRHVTPCAQVLMRRVSGCRRFGALPTNLHGAEAAVASDTVSGIAVRGARFYNIGDSPILPEGWVYRFDVLAGA